MRDHKKKWWWLGFISATLIYLLVRLIGLTKLPVFADESIYIRWSQLIIEDWPRYLFFPLNDGKTPLPIWLMIPQLKLGLATGLNSQLWWGRFTSVLIGWGQMIFLALTALELFHQTQKTSPSLSPQISPFKFIRFWQLLFAQKKIHSERTQLSFPQILITLTGFLLAIFLPIWFFYQRMALTDNLLCLSFIVTLYCWLRCGRRSRDAVADFVAHQETLSCGEKVKNHGYLKTFFNIWLFLTAFCWGFLGLWSKMPALLFAPALLFFIFYPRPTSWSSWWQRLVQLALVGFLSLLIFSSLRFLTPAFGQLFSRGSDFLFSWSEIVTLNFNGLLTNFRANLIEFAKIIHFYFGWGLLLLPLVVVFFCPSARRPQLILLLSALGFALPITLLGKVVYPRYYLPAFIPLTLMVAIAVPQVWSTFTGASLSFWRRLLAGSAFGFALLNFIWLSTSFIITANTSPDRLALPAIDVTQYLGEWSSGHGIDETTALIEEFVANPDNSLLVLTEGYFGTLPDALLMNFFGRNLPNFSLEGIGQPIYQIPATQLARYDNFDQVWLVVNSHRLNLALDSTQFITEFCRPTTGICLQIWRLK